MGMFSFSWRTAASSHEVSGPYEAKTFELNHSADSPISAQVGNDTKLAESESKRLLMQHSRSLVFSPLCQKIANKSGHRPASTLLAFLDQRYDSLAFSGVLRA